MTTPEPEQVSAPTTSREKLSASLQRILISTRFVLFVPVILRLAFASAESKLPSVLELVTLIGCGAWLLLGFVYVVVRYLPSLRYSLRAFLLTIVTLQVPIILLVKFDRMYGLGILLLTAWLMGVIYYLAKNRVRSEQSAGPPIVRD